MDAMKLKARYLTALGVLAPVLYVAMLVFAARSALYPRWYHPAVATSQGKAFAPCSEYQKQAYRFCGDPGSDWNLKYQIVAGTRHLPDREVGFEGWYVKAVADSKALVILVHGGGADRRAMVKHVPYLQKAGYDALVIDCQNHGMAPNDGRGISFGRYEAESVRAAVEWAKAHGVRAGEPIVVMGTSQGAVASLLAAASEKAIAAVVAENPFSSLHAVIQDVPIMTWVPTFMRDQAVYLLSFWHGTDFNELDAKVYGPRITQPVLLIHGADDDFVPYRHSQEWLTRLASTDKGLWLVPYGNHERLWNKAPEDYENHVLDFFTRVLRPTPAVQAAAPVSAGSDVRSRPFQGSEK